MGPARAVPGPTCSRPAPACCPGPTKPAIAAAALALSNGTRWPDRTIRLAAAGREGTPSGSDPISGSLLPSREGLFRSAPPPARQPGGSGAAGRGAAAGAMAAAGPFALVTSCAGGFAAEELVKRESMPRGPGLAASQPRSSSAPSPGSACSSQG